MIISHWTNILKFPYSYSYSYSLYSYIANACSYRQSRPDLPHFIFDSLREMGNVILPGILLFYTPDSICTVIPNFSSDPADHNGPDQTRPAILKYGPDRTGPDQINFIGCHCLHESSEPHACMGDGCMGPE